MIYVATKEEKTRILEDRREKDGLRIVFEWKFKNNSSSKKES